MCSLKLSSLLHSTLPLQTLQLRFLIRNCVMKNVIPEQAETYNKVAAFPSWQHNPESEQNGIGDCIECSRMFIYLLALHLPLSLSHFVCEAGLGRGVSEISMRFDGKTPSRRAMTAEQSRAEDNEDRRCRVIIKIAPLNYSECAECRVLSSANKMSSIFEGYFLLYLSLPLANASSRCPCQRSMGLLNHRTHFGRASVGLDTPWWKCAEYCYVTYYVIYNKLI